MPTPPSFVLPPDHLAARLRDRAGRLLAGAGRQRVVLAAIALVALACASVIWFRGAPHPSGQPIAGQQPPGAFLASATGAGAAADSGPGVTLPLAPGAGAGTAASSAGVGTGAGLLAVDVVGRVRHPGLIRLPLGSRVIDAIQAAGGTAPGADLDAVNLARKLTDGEQLRVPRHGETVVLPAGAQPDPGSGMTPGSQPAGPLDLNTATAEQLDTLPGVGQVTAGRIIAYRSAHPFTSVDDLRQVPGIGDRRFATLKDLVTVSNAP